MDSGNPISFEAYLGQDEDYFVNQFYILPSEMEGFIQGEGEPSETMAPLAEDAVPMEVGGITPGQPSQAILSVDGNAPLSGDFTQNPPVSAVASFDPSALGTAMLGNWTPQAVQGGVPVWDQQNSVPTTDCGLQPMANTTTGIDQNWTMPQPPFLLAPATTTAPMPESAMGFDGVGQNQQSGAGMMYTGLAGSFQTQPTPYQPGPPGYTQDVTTEMGLAGIPQSQSIQYRPSGYAQGAVMNTAQTPFTIGGSAPNYPAASMQNFPAAAPLTNHPTTAANLNPTTTATQSRVAGANLSPSPGSSPKQQAGGKSAKSPPEPLPPVCPHCQASQATLGLDNQKYSRHIARSCPTLKFLCDLCGKKLCNKDYVNEHKRVSCRVAKARRDVASAAQTAQGGQQQFHQGMYVQNQIGGVPFTF